jgi:signal transduction histidine kinase
MGISGFHEFLMYHVNSIEPKEVRDKIIKTLNKQKSAIDNMSALIKQVRESEAIDSGKLQLNKETVDLHHAVSNLKITFESRLSEKHIKFKVNLTETKICADTTIFIHSVLANIFSNALKFSPEGSSIYLNSSRVDNFVRIDVIDTGIGMSNELKAKLFDYGAKTSRVGTNGEKGTGFGLPTVKKYVEAEGGRLEVSSNEDPLHGPTGTTFSLFYPMAVAGVEDKKRPTASKKNVGVRAKLCLVDNKEDNGAA